MSLLAGAFVLVAAFVTATVSGVLGMAGGLLLMGALLLVLPTATAFVVHVEPSTSPISVTARVSSSANAAPSAKKFHVDGRRKLTRGASSQTSAVAAASVRSRTSR